MAAVTFASKLKDDGSLTVPKDAVEELGILPGDRVRVRLESAYDYGDHTKPAMLSRARQAMTRRTPQQLAEAQARAMQTYQPQRAVPAGQNLADVVSGQWPGDESDEQIEAALRELS